MGYCYVVGYTVGNFVLRGHLSIIPNVYIRRNTPLNEHFEYGYPNYNVLLNFYTSPKKIYYHKMLAARAT